ncbi:unnamed protein product [Clonostachys rhizophaga]|uniref:Enoyl reductase (ER) domain-containing protein n=1 Tax=Clonostachys rhizophaga TaxID=160324 RepID=A0A9N9V4W8_9HYPO|nr:unnamed protein product [Clonostachys rhizophaga]
MVLVTDALVVPGKGLQPTLQSVTIEEPLPDEAIVEIHAVGICHTDISCMNGIIPTSFPAVLGHEGAGVILKVGSGLQEFSSGDKVLLSFNSCGTCQDCRLGYSSYCQSYASQNFGGRREDGTQPLALTGCGTKLSCNFFGQSSFSKVALVSGRCMVKVPKSTDLSLFAPLGCGIQTGVGTVLNTLDVRANQSLAVFGVGAVGLSCIMAAKLRGADPVIAIDVSPARLELAKELGATHTILSADKAIDLPAEIRKISGGNGVFRAADCSGVPAVIEQMISSLGSRGKAATVGAPAPGRCVKVEVFSHIVKGTHYIGCCEGDSDPAKMIPYLIDEQSRGNFPLEKLVTLYDGVNYKKAFDNIQKSQVIKAVLVWK